MKKIIATVLAMVMALALCTTAFAATSSETTTNGTTSTLAAADKYNLRTLTNNDKTAIVLAKYTTLSTKVVVNDSVETKSYIPAYYTGSDNAIYMECVAESATYRVFKGDTFVGYVTGSLGTTVPDFNSFSAVAVSEGTTCGSYAADGYLVDNGTTKTAHAAVTAYADGTKAVVDGKLVAYNALAEIAVINHDFTTGATVTYKANSTTPIAVVCKTCKNSFDVVKANALGSYTGSYVSGAAPTATAIGSADYVIKTGSVSTGTTTGGNTTSPKTFDAGIAMYVGMALTSVAGSALVIGKKKEF